MVAMTKPFQAGSEDHSKTADLDIWKDDWGGGGVRREKHGLRDKG